MPAGIADYNDRKYDQDPVMGEEASIQSLAR
jgi:hypothetical protein